MLQIGVICSHEYTDVMIWCRVGLNQHAVKYKEKPTLQQEQTLLLSVRVSDMDAVNGQSAFRDTGAAFQKDNLSCIIMSICDLGQALVMHECLYRRTHQADMQRRGSLIQRKHNRLYCGAGAALFNGR